MLFEKNTLFGLLVPWFTGCSAVSPGHWPFCARASISVPGAPASSLFTGSQVLVLNPGAEICAPVWVATALLCTFQPPPPRLEMSLAPVSDGELSSPALCGNAAPEPDTPAPAAAPGTSQASVVTDTAAAHRTERGRVVPFIAGHSCLAAAAARDGCPRLNGRLVRNLSKQTCQEGKRGRCGTALKQPR